MSNTWIELLLFGAYFAVFLRIIQQWRFFRTVGLSPSFLPMIFVVKCLMGLLIFLVYTFYYPLRSEADILKYFDDGAVLFDIAWQHPGQFLSIFFGQDDPSHHELINRMQHWIKPNEDVSLYNDNRILIRLHAVLRCFSLGSHHVHGLFMAFFSTIGLQWMYQSLAHFFSSKKSLLAVAVFALPSVLFWTSSITKEALVVCVMGGAMKAGFSLREKPSWATVSLLIGSLSIGTLLKPYIALSMLPCLISFLWSSGKSWPKALLRYTVVLSAGLLLGWAASYLIKHQSPIDLLMNRQSDFVGHAKAMQAQSLIDVPSLCSSIVCLLKSIPLAIHNALLLPVPGVTSGIFQHILGVEMYGLLLYLMYALVFRRSINITPNLSLFLISMIFIQALLIGWTVPVVGAIVRYRVPILPFIAVLAVGLSQNASTGHKIN